jgi:hypothetical protein
MPLFAVSLVDIGPPQRNPGVDPVKHRRMPCDSTPSGKRRRRLFIAGSELEGQEEESSFWRDGKACSWVKRKGLRKLTD